MYINNVAKYYSEVSADEGRHEFSIEASLQLETNALDGTKFLEFSVLVKV